ITLIAPALDDLMLAHWAARFHHAAVAKLGATRFLLPDVDDAAPVDDSGVTLAVVGAHLSGMPLNYQLTSRGARLLEACATAPQYRLYALPHTAPPKPGLARAHNGSGAAIEVELWSVPVRSFGSLVADVPSPLAIGTVMLADGRQVKGFVCESYALAGARDISSFGGWRKFVAQAG
ncbi:MAG TPA: allophanate hydrolase, partial [Burkholderiales bacterium]|nr:allophanate hydrolase [Burkholderiales bacterium]